MDGFVPHPLSPSIRRHHTQAMLTRLKLHLVLCFPIFLAAEKKKPTTRLGCVDSDVGNVWSSPSIWTEETITAAECTDLFARSVSLFLCSTIVD